LDKRIKKTLNRKLGEIFDGQKRRYLACGQVIEMTFRFGEPGRIGNNPVIIGICYRINLIVWLAVD